MQLLEKDNTHMSQKGELNYKGMNKHTVENNRKPFILNFSLKKQMFIIRKKLTN